MAVMVGFGSFWMENLPPCTPVAALKGDLTHLVSTNHLLVHIYNIP